MGHSAELMCKHAPFLSSYNGQSVCSSNGTATQQCCLVQQANLLSKLLLFPAHPSGTLGKSVFCSTVMV